MRRYQAVLAAVAVLVCCPLFAGNDQSVKECEIISSACISAGYVGEETPGKTFWHDCMKPILLGQAVPAVLIDSKDASICKKAKIQKMKSELREFENSPA